MNSLTAKSLLLSRFLEAGYKDAAPFNCGLSKTTNETSLVAYKSLKETEYPCIIHTYIPARFSTCAKSETQWASTPSKWNEKDAQVKTQPCPFTLFQRPVFKALLLIHLLSQQTQQSVSPLGLVVFSSVSLASLSATSLYEQWPSIMVRIPVLHYHFFSLSAYIHDPGLVFSRKTALLGV
jgi:hypothetical protein